ncbi:HDOD domain-containing protein [Treponema parvum]|uniref:HDOD domain-containing protein n=1 Tax=Treponema parvum TaxID=138851 RepID=A0A975IE76_9SPIR|nr:HDOD domain-containing protein [Treponema parvum]QTQ13004.1 HDOD domain-containing protein [Treponema parvum]
MENSNKVTVDRSKIRMAIETGVPLSITTYTLPHDVEVYMTEVLTVFLTELGQKQMIEYLSYCLSELITNAKKANTKRVYFRTKNLDINNIGDYEKGMATFKEDTMKNINYYLELQKKAGLYVKFRLQMRKDKIRIEVRNNAEMTVFEYKRVHDKLSRAQQYTSINEAISQILDSSEGAGLGLIIMILMLSKIGLTEENFQTLCQDGETITRITLPLNKETQDSLTKLSAEFVKSINEIPQFPEHITKINRLLNDPDSKMSDIAAAISGDVSLTTELLHLVNSAAFALATPCHNVADAVKLIGIRGIKNLLFSIGSMETLSPGNDKVKRKIWENAKKVAFFSYNMARNYCSSERQLIDDSYICGLLHDIGKLLFQTAHPNLINDLRTKFSEKDIPVPVFELMIAGVNHGEIGAMITERWNFPEVITNVIRYHHDPDQAPEAYRKLTSLISLASLMVDYYDGNIDFYQIDESLLVMFHIESQEQFDRIVKKLGQALEKEND